MQCRESCINNKTYDRFKKHSFTSTITVSSKEKLLSGIDLKNTDNNRDFIKIHNECAGKNAPNPLAETLNTLRSQTLSQDHSFDGNMLFLYRLLSLSAQDPNKLSLSLLPIF